MRGRLSWGAAVCAALVTGCVGDDGDARNGGTDATAGDALVLDTSATAPDGDTAGGPVAIVSFTTDFATITRGARGADPDSVLVEGAATLTWRTQNAASVRLLVDGVAVALDGCVPAGAGGCAAAGGLVVRPTEATTFTLEALGPDGACEGECPRASVDVAIAPPARATLEAAMPVVPAGGDATFTYTVDAPTWAIGLGGFDGDGARTLTPCVPASEADAAAPCAVSDDGAGVPLATGLVVVAGVSRDVTILVSAENGADDGLGDIALGDVLAGVTVPVEIAAFGATPARVLPGGDIVLAWEVRGAQAVAIDTPSDTIVGLSTCVGLGADGRGFCTVSVDADARLGDVSFTLVATQEGGALGEAQAAVEVIAGPAIAAFDAAPQAIVPGQPALVAWTAYGADAVALVATPDVVDGDCGDLGADGYGGCEIVVRPGTAPGPVTLTLTASHAAVGPPAVAQRVVEVLPAPRVETFVVDDDTVLATARPTLSWRVHDASFVVLSEASGAIAPAALGVCSAVDGGDGTGECMLQLPSGLAPGALDFTLHAIGPTGARSAPATLTIIVGERPVVTFTATPQTLPEGGGEVTLDWTAVTATQVVVTDDAEEPDTIVDSDEGTPCVDASPCSPAGDRITLTAVQSSLYTLVATNAFGATVATARVTLEGAPELAALTLGGVDVRGGSIVVDGARELAWEVLALTDNDTVRLERAALPAPNGDCAAVAPGAWALVAGFPKTGVAQGAAMLTPALAAGECYRFVAEDVDPTPTQRASAVFKVRRAPVLASFTVSDDTVQAGDAVALTWASQLAYGVVVSASPVGAVTTQDLAGCTAASGSCSITLQPGTPLGDVVLGMFAVGEEGAHTPTTAVPVTVGVGARITSFTATPPSTASPVDVLLAWASSDGATLTLRDAAGELLASDDAATIGEGSLSVRVSATTTWTLSVANAFGSQEAQATVFVGPSIDALTVNGGNALDGAESVVTGPVTVAWTTTSANGVHRLEAVKAPANGNCATAGLAWAKVYEDDDGPAASASHMLGTLVDNTCVRLSVTNSEVPPQSSSATFLVRELPGIGTFVTSPDTIGSGGGTVIVDIGVRGATGLTLTAQYRSASGEVLGTRSVCNQGSLNEGALTGGAGVDEVSCAHTIVACNLLCLNNGMPSGTKSVRYLLSVGDPEGDGASATTAGGQDVSVP